MTEAVSDTGPILHLHEIDRLTALGVFENLLVPQLVLEELLSYGLSQAQLSAAGVHITAVSVPLEDCADILNEPNPLVLHPADAQVFVIARGHHYRLPIVTDDLALRKRLEQQRLSRTELEQSIEALFNVSTLHLSRAFRAYIQQLIDTLP